ncbi:GRIP domain-containing protein [Schizosaccharomyces cryophilus OY26]|uniref:GRIP domain-containing protein n=1 Tax=Schizosaccharomyces cryophilus (strain OY26 / ATCC MYA-4695 / CBS 11777 / NBRC 106824 / NRRL Y48691) TaxID=653667 RepID=S9VV32_SCHCR|nr:GRIP domain-containing protein [Schizosaccharomyces cryophilus OY26]EPY51648.1 GRIP domain-containing protein [Schizosaccharomyces cryophilus OY26]
MATSLAVKDDLEPQNQENGLKENSTVSPAPSVSSSSKKKKKNKKKKKTVTTEANGEHQENKVLEDEKDSLISELQLKNKDFSEEIEALRKTLAETKLNNVDADESKGLLSKEMESLRKEIKYLKETNDAKSEETSRIQEENQNLQEMLRNVGNELVDSRDEVKELIQKIQVLDRKDETLVQLSEVKSNEITPKVLLSAGESKAEHLNGLSKEVIDKEYARNVLIQFLENQEHRDQILPILAIALDLDDIHQQILLKSVN